MIFLLVVLLILAADVLCWALCRTSSDVYATQSRPIDWEAEEWL